MHDPPLETHRKSQNHLFFRREMHRRAMANLIFYILDENHLYFLRKVLLLDFPSTTIIAKALVFLRKITYFASENFIFHYILLVVRAKSLVFPKENEKTHS